MTTATSVDERIENYPDELIQRNEDRVHSTTEDSSINESSSTNSDSDATNDLQEIANQLATSVDFFRDHASDIANLRTFPYKRLPSYHNNYRAENGDENARFEDRKRLVRDVTHFPLLPKKGKLQLPMALVCETEGHPQKILVVFNYWRQLKACQQRKLKAVMQRFYVRPNVTNERLILSSPPKASMLAPAPESPQDIDTLNSCEKRKYEQRDGYEMTTPWGFRCLETCTQLAEKLGLCPIGKDPQKACDMLRTANLEMPRTKCKVGDCIYPSLARNHGYCCRHSLHFGPTPGKVNGRRGYLLLGDVYTRPYFATSGSEEDGGVPATTKKLSACSCRNEICVGIGYSPAMIQFDLNRLPKDLRDELWSHRDALDMTARTQCRISRNQTEGITSSESKRPILRLAPWHFHPEHREFLPDGTWKLLDSLPSTPSFSKNETGGEGVLMLTKNWNGMPLPTYSPKAFLNEPIMKEYATRKEIISSSTDMLPNWCREYARLEEGPYSVSEIQLNFLWDRTIQLERELASRMASFRAKERAMEIELEKLEEKHDEKRFVKWSDKRQRRNNKPSAVGGKPSSCGALQAKNKSRLKRKRSKTDPCLPEEYSGMDGGNNVDTVNTPDNDQHDSSDIEINNPHCLDSRQMEHLHYEDDLHQQHHHRHLFPHSYPPQPQHHSQSYPNRDSAGMNLHHHPLHYHQQQQRTQEGSYPQHHEQAYPPRHDERDNQYRGHPSEHRPEAQQHQQRSQHPRYFSEH